MARIGITVSIIFAYLADAARPLQNRSTQVTQSHAVKETFGIRAGHRFKGYSIGYEQFVPSRIFPISIVAPISTIHGALSMRPTTHHTIHFDTKGIFGRGIRQSDQKVGPGRWRLPSKDTSRFVFSDADGALPVSTTHIVENIAPVNKLSEDNGVRPICCLPAGSRACSVFCGGPIFEAVQLSGVFQDSKTFVDMPLKRDPEHVLQAYAELGSPTDSDTLRRFLKDYFDEVGDDLKPWTPSDFVQRPASLVAITDASQRDWALSLNGLWKTLGRIQDGSVASAPQRHSALVRRHGMIVPGGRFRETYYWDTYWIVRGLVECNMTTTARGVVENLLDDVRTYGFVPNGGRCYYLDRSQPPLLTEMVIALHNAVPDSSWLESVLPVLEQEYRFWMDPQNGHIVSVPVSSSKGFAMLNRYFSNKFTPRPESYAKDIETAKRAEETLGREAADVYRNLRSAAESGWDFSSRWLATAIGGPSDLATINASEVVPVDLNSILYRVELGLAHLHEQVADGTKAGTNSQKYLMAAAHRAELMHNLLWDPTSESYRDFRLDAGAPSSVVALSNYYGPLWAGLLGPRSPHGGTRARSLSGMISSLERSGLLQPGGASTTTIATGQQWDAPNAWPPLQLMMIEGLDRFRGENPEAAKLADRLSAEWLESCALAWRKDKVMFEKYDAHKPGKTGDGGEYDPQVGFGWTNGVALVLLKREEILRRGYSRALSTQDVSTSGEDEDTYFIFA